MMAEAAGSRSAGFGNDFAKLNWHFDGERAQPLVMTAERKRSVAVNTAEQIRTLFSFDEEYRLKIISPRFDSALL